MFSWNISGENVYYKANNRGGKFTNYYGYKFLGDLGHFSQAHHIFPLPLFLEL